MGRGLEEEKKRELEEEREKRKEDLEEEKQRGFGRGKCKEDLEEELGIGTRRAGAEVLHSCKSDSVAEAPVFIPEKFSAHRSVGARPPPRGR